MSGRMFNSDTPLMTRYIFIIERAALGILAAFSFFPTFLALYSRWQEPVSYYDHAIIVPWVSMWMAWKAGRPPILKKLSNQQNIAAYLLFCFSLFLQLFGSAQQITVLQGTSWVLWIWASVMGWGGVAAWLHYRWALLYLLLMIPIPSFFMAQLTFGMRQLSTTLAAWTLQGTMALLGLPFARVGNRLHFADYHVTIVDACSGMNTLVTLIAIGWVLIYMETSKLKSWMIGALLIPTAIFANLMRILAICAFVALGWGNFAFGAGHSWIGIFTVGIALFFLALGVRIPKSWEALLIKKFPRWLGYSPSDRSQKNQEIGSHAPSRRRLILYGVTLAFFALATARIQWATPSTLTGSPSSDTQETTQAPPLDIPHWKTVPLPMDPTTYDIVGTRNAHMFRFEPLDGAGVSSTRPVYLYRLFSQNSRKIGHPPELCYGSEGYETLARGPIQIQVHQRQIPAIRMIVKRGSYFLLVYYWYRIGGVETASYVEQQLRWSLGQIKRLAFLSDEQPAGTMIRISTEIENPGQDQEALKKAAKKLESWLTEQDRLNASSL